MSNLRHLLDEWYARPGNGAGGALHIVVDDYNTETEHIRFCVINASLADRVAMYPLVQALLAIAEDDRQDAMIKAWALPFDRRTSSAMKTTRTPGILAGLTGVL